MSTRRLLLALSTSLALTACAPLTGVRSPTPEAPADVSKTAKPARIQTEARPALREANLNRSTEARPAAAESAQDEAAASPPADLWARIRNGFAMELPDKPRVAAELEFFAQRPAYMERVTDRAEPYLYYIVSEIEARGLPMELALLPIVESAFQPFAYSPGRAAGIWQFIPSTGLAFGLKQTWWYDGRRDIIASTDAALTYLEQLHAQFDDWELALAAYNAGQGTVRGAIRRNGQQGRPTDYWNLPLPAETRGYVPRLLALRILIDTPEAHGLSLRSLPNEAYKTVVDTGSQLDLALAAELADLPIEKLYQLNPGFNRWATDPDGPHRLVVPLDRAERFETALAELPEDQRVRWHRHQVRSGQTLSHIARDYNTSVAIIQQANNLRDHRIRAGTHLLVPAAKADAAEYSLSAPQRLARLQSQERNGQRHTHTVRNGDTLWDLSRSYGVSVNQLTSWNGMAPGDLLRPGQELVLWLPAEGGTQANGRAPVPQLQSVQYTVRRGDSLYLIAKRFNVTVAQLRQWNELPQRGFLQPGQRLTVKVDITRQEYSGRI